MNRIGARANDIEREIQKLQKESERYESTLSALQDEVNNLQDEYKLQIRELENRTALQNALNTKYNQENIQLINIKNHIASLKREFKTQIDKKESLIKQGGTIQTELETTRLDIAALEESNANEEAKLIGLYERRTELEARIRKIEENVQAIRSKIVENENALRNERKKKDDLSHERSALKDKVTELKIQIGNMAERMEVEWHVDIQALDPSALFDRPSDEFLVAQVEANVMALREKYTKFGEVNTTAIEAYNEVKERYDFINTQKDDLLAAKNDLLTTIKEIDETAKEKFMASFHNIRENFIKVFRTLFTENDSCDLVLLEAEDPLESKIEIIARPKGKRPLTINQLSGGEKTLTAISLLFAIYLLKPAPFCIFDEVDAPLDDANIDKFNNIINEFSNQSQFIIVTHNKRTMASTGVIYGVTMEEAGISRVLPIDLTALKLK
jgi:chromosome segregation protein